MSYSGDLNIKNNCISRSLGILASVSGRKTAMRGCCRQKESDKGEVSLNSLKLRKFSGK
jgi:hypothetical protein